MILGGSYIGLEFAQMYRRFGSKVHRHRARARGMVVARGPRRFDRRSKNFSSPKASRSGSVQTCKSARSLENTHDRVIFANRDGTEKPRRYPARIYWWRSAAFPNTDALGLDKAGDQNRRARLHYVVDDQLAHQRRTACGPWVTSTVAEHLPIPRTTIMKSSPPTCMDNDPRKV